MLESAIIELCVILVYIPASAGIQYWFSNPCEDCQRLAFSSPSGIPQPSQRERVFAAAGKTDTFAQSRLLLNLEVESPLTMSAKDRHPAPTTPEDAERIRSIARAALSQRDFASILHNLDPKTPDPSTLLESLRVYQAELELQNAELQETRQDAERALQRFNAFFVHHPLALLIMDKQGLILEANAEAQRLFALTGHSTRHRFFFRHVNKENAVIIHNALLQSQDRDTATTVTVILQPTTHDAFYAELHLAHLPALPLPATHAPFGAGAEQFVCVIVDLTERLEQQAALESAYTALRQSEAAYRIVADYSMDWDYWLNCQYQYQYVSPACETITGYPAARFYTDPDFMNQIIHPDDRALWQAHFSQIFSETELADCHAAHHGHDSLILRIIHAQGETRWIEHQCRLVFATDGQCLGRRGVNRDITARHLAEQRAAWITRLYETLSRAERAMNQAETQEELFATLCHITVETGQFLACLITLRGEADQPPYIAASHGLPESVVAQFPLPPNLSANDPGTEPHPLAIALFGGQPHACTDCNAENLPESWRSWAQQAQTQSCLHYPIYRLGVQTGCLSLFSCHQDHFTPDIIDLVEQLANDLSLALDRRTHIQTLAENEARFRNIFEHVEHIAVQGYDHDLRVTFWNRASEQLYGYSAAEALGCRVEDLLIPPNLQARMAHLRTHLQDRAPQVQALFGGEQELRHKDGSSVHVYSDYVVRHNAGGQMEIYALDVDLTPLRQAENRLEQATYAFANTTEGVVITGNDNTILYSNHAATRITGYAPDELIGHPLRLFEACPPNPPQDHQLWQQVREQGRWEGERWCQHKSGQAYLQHLAIAGIHDTQGNIRQYVAVFSDITAQRQSEEERDFITSHDVLTRLPNRILLKDRLQHALDRSQRTRAQLAVLFLDLDRFKTLNESQGHSAGDALLCELSQRLRDILRAGDTLARLGGDEFVIVLEADPKAFLLPKVLSKLLALFEQPFAVQEQPYYATCSIGISLYPEDGQTPEALIGNAELAMYQAKAKGRNTWQYYRHEMGAQSQQRYTLENDLRGALSRKEFSLYFQPQIFSSNSMLAGAEVLLRWTHPTQGMVSPAMFIPIAEEIGIIAEIGDWVLEETCRYLRTWIDAGVDLPRIAVNLSMQQLERGDLNTRVMQLLKQYRLAPTLLELEVTESMLMRQAESVSAILHDLRTQGITIAVDDFGTGYSSLGHLKRIPLDRLKIDQSFVKDIGVNPKDEAITQTIIRLGHSLNLTVVAEGVETAAQERFLRAAGCDLAQGYRYGRPMPADEFNKAVYTFARSRRDTQKNEG